MSIESAFSAELFSVVSILTWHSMSMSLPGPWFPSLCGLICMDILEMKVSVVKTADNWPWAYYLPKLKLASKVKVGRALGEIKSKHGPSFVNPSIDNQGRNFILLPITKEGTLPFCWETRKKLSQTEGFLVTPQKRLYPSHSCQKVYLVLHQKHPGAGEVVPWLGALAALVEDRCSPLNTHIMAHNHPHLNFQGDPTPSSDFPGHQALMWYTGTHTGKILVYIQ